MKKQTILAGCVLATSGLATLALAHGGATGIVKERMDGMMAMSEAIKSLSAMMRGDTEYDANAVRESADVIKSHAGEALTALFPEGSVSDVSEAKSDIWSEWETFSAYANRLDVYAEGLAAAADNGLMHEDRPSVTGGQSDMMGSSDNMMGSSTTMGSGMMGSGMGGNGMMGDAANMMDADQLAQMPADGVFNMLTQTCSACHTQFRAEKN